MTESEFGCLFVVDVAYGTGIQKWVLYPDAINIPLMI